MHCIINKKTSVIISIIASISLISGVIYLAINNANAQQKKPHRAFVSKITVTGSTAKKITNVQTGQTTVVETVSSSKPTTIQRPASTKPVEQGPSVDELIAERDALKMAIAQLEQAIADAKNNKKDSGKCTINGQRKSLSVFQTEQAMKESTKRSKEKELATLEADLASKNAQLTKLTDENSELDEKSKSMIVGTTATSLFAAGGTAGLIVTGIDFFKTSQTEKNMNNGQLNCEKWGLIGR